MRFSSSSAQLADAFRSYFRRPPIVLELALLAAVLSSAVIILMAVGSAQVLADEGSEGLPLVYLLLAGVSVPLASGISAALCRWPVSRISSAASLASLCLALGLRAALAFDVPYASSATCIAAYALEIVFDTLFWLSASQHLPTLELKRQTPFLAAAFGLGGIVAGFVATLFCEIFSGEDLLLLDAAFFGLCFAQYCRIGRLSASAEEGEADESEPGLIEALKATCNVVRTFPITGAIALTVLLMSALFCLQDYLAMTVYGETFKEPDALASFMAIVYAGHQLAELLILAVCGRLLLESAGPIVRNLVFPLSTCAGLLAMLASWTLPAAVFVHANVIALSNAVFEPVKTLDFAAVPYRVSAQVRVLVDGIIYPLGVALSAFGLLWLQHWGDPKAILLIAVVVALIFLAVSAVVGMWFLPHLLRSLRLRAISPSEYARAEGCRVFSASDIRQLLNHPSIEARRFGTDLAARLAPELLSPPAPDQPAAFRSPQALVPLVAPQPEEVSRPLRLRRNDYAQVGETPPFLCLATSGSGRSNRRRSDAGIWRLALIQRREAMDRIHEVGRGLEDRSRAVRRAAASLLATFGAAAVPTAALRLRSDRPEVSEAAILALGGIGSRKAVQLLKEHLLPLFQQTRLNLEALEALRHLGDTNDDDARSALEAWLIDSNRRIVRRVFLVKSALGNPRDVKFLHALTKARETRTRSNAFEALINMPTKRFIQPVMPLLEAASIAATVARSKQTAGPAPPTVALAIDKATAHDRWARLLADRLFARRTCGTCSEEELAMLDLALFLKTTPLFSAVALEDITRLAQLAETVTKGPGEVIVNALEPVRHIHILRSGTAHLVLDGATVETLEAHRSFGEMALFGEELPRVSLRAATETVLVRFPLSLFADLVAENPDVLSPLVLDLNTRINALYGRLSAANRVAPTSNTTNTEQRAKSGLSPIAGVAAAAF